jgi:YafQ family addiction module toxin component
MVLNKPYKLIIQPSVDKIFKKLAKKDKVQLKAINSKIKEILKSPYRFKPLKKPLQNRRGVHIGSFIIIFQINESERKVIIVNYKHHDEAYLT